MHKAVKLTVTHSKVIKVIWPVAQLLIRATLHAEVRGDVLHGGVGEHTDTHTHTQYAHITHIIRYVSLYHITHLCRLHAVNLFF